MALEKEQRGTTMYIFATNDTDSLCALKILTVSGFRVWYSSIPVGFAFALKICLFFLDNIAPRRSRLRNHPSFLCFAPAAENSRDQADGRGYFQPGFHQLRGLDPTPQRMVLRGRAQHEGVHN